MFKNYLKTGWRNITRNKTTTLINLFGLSVALVAFIFIALWVQNELSFDSFHKDAEDIYLVQTEFRNEPSSITPFPAADALKKVTGTKYAARMGWWPGILKTGEQMIDEKKGIAVDADWFKIFDYKIVSGNIDAFNSDPHSILFTESKARQLFGNVNPVGQTILLDTTLFQVRAVVRDNPVNSSLQFDMMVPIAARMAHRKNDVTSWGNASYRTFVKLNTGTNLSGFEDKMSHYIKELSGHSDLSYSLQPIADLHFDTNANDPAFRRGSRTAVYVFSILALLLLVTASINYINLTIAKSNVRTKEISIRKITGGTSKHLFSQFLTESFLMCLLAVIVSIIIILLTLPAFNEITETEFHLTLASPLLWIVSVAALMFTVLCNGIIPAATISLFKPLDYLRGHTIVKLGNVFVRKGLVVFQSIIGIVFIIGAITIYKQMHLAQTSAAQYNRSQTLSVHLPSTLVKKFDYDQQKINQFSQLFKNELRKYPSIQNVALTSGSIEGGMNSTGIDGWYWPGQDTSLKGSVSYMTVEPEAKKIFNVQVVKGRWFNNNASDRKNYILNETAVSTLGIHEPVIGQLFGKNGEDTGQIIGVVKDYNFSSLYNKIEPLVIRNSDNQLRMEIFASIQNGNIPQGLAAVETTWKKLIPDAPFSYQFMNEAFDNLYKNDLKISKLVWLFSCIAIIISALGLFGLAAFVAEQRRKEVGIRKVLGATVTQITAMLSKDFVWLVVIAFFIASPVAYWLMNLWLQNFVYRVNVNGWIFLTAGLAVVMVALITVSFQSIKAAIANPVKSLRTE